MRLATPLAEARRAVLAVLPGAQLNRGFDAALRRMEGLSI